MGSYYRYSALDADNAERAPACWPSAGHSRAQCRPVTAFGRHSRAQWRPSAGERGSSPSAVLHCLHLGCRAPSGSFACLPQCLPWSRIVVVVCYRQKPAGGKN